MGGIVRRTEQANYFRYYKRFRAICKTRNQLSLCRARLPADLRDHLHQPGWPAPCGIRSADGMAGMSRDGEESVLFMMAGGERRCFTRLYGADVLAYDVLPTHGATGLRTLLPQRSLRMPLWRFL